MARLLYTTTEMILWLVSMSKSTHSSCTISDFGLISRWFRLAYGKLIQFYISIRWLDFDGRTRLGIPVSHVRIRGVRCVTF